MNKLFYSCLLLLSANFSMAQTVLINGQVVDQLTGEGLPFCNVYIEGTTSGVSTDIDGRYQFECSINKDSLSASAIGYQTQVQTIPNNSNPVQINFSLKSIDHQLSEVVVFAGENPANIIVKNIISNKKLNHRNHLTSYQCEAYSKLELDIDNVPEKIRDKKLFKPFEFVFENIDSTSEDQPFLPVFLTETVGDIYYSKETGNQKIQERAQRASGLENESINTYVNKIQEEIDVYDNWIYIMEKTFTGPFNKKALQHYEYYIIDSLVNDKSVKSYQLKFKPKREKENTFLGNFWVEDGSFAITELSMQMSAGTNINLIKQIKIHQSFIAFENHWLPEKQQMKINFKILKNVPGFIGRRTSSYQKYKTGSPQSIASEKNSEKPAPFVEDPSFWDIMRHGELNKNEAGIYVMIDSIKNVAVYKSWANTMYFLGSGFLPIKHLELGPYYSIYSSNPIEGDRFSLGAWTSNSCSKKIRIGGYGAYGLKDRKFKYAGDVQINVSKIPRKILRFSHRNDIDIHGVDGEAIGEGNSLSGMYRRAVPQKLIHTIETKGYYESYWKGGWAGKVEFKQRQLSPYPFREANGTLFKFKYYSSEESNSVIDTTTSNTSFSFKLRYAYKEKFVEGNFSRTSLGSKYPIIEAKYTTGLKGVLTGKYNYQRLDLSLKHYVRTNPIGWIDYQISAGKIFGQLPYLLLHVFPGNETYFLGNSFFNSMNRYEFAADTYASIMIEHHWDGFILNKVPLIKKLNWRTVGSFKAAIGSMTSSNQKMNQLNAYHDEEINASGFKVPTRPYLEAGVGIENIFRIIRIDGVWRLSHLENKTVAPFSLRVSLKFSL